MSASNSFCCFIYRVCKPLFALGKVLFELFEDMIVDEKGVLEEGIVAVILGKVLVATLL